MRISQMITENNMSNKEEKDQAAVAASEHLNLKVKSQDGEEVFFKIKATTQFKKLMDAYVQRQGVILLSFSSPSPMCVSSSMARGSTKPRRPRK